MKKYKELREILPPPTTDGIFQAIMRDTQYVAPWVEVASGLLLDTLYLYNHSGGKITSPLLDNVENLETLASICIEQYGRKWELLWDNITANIDILSPINYSVTTKGNVAHDGQDTDTTQYGKNDTINYGKSSTKTGSENTTDNSKITMSHTPNYTEVTTGGYYETNDLEHGMVVTETPDTSSVTTRDVYGFNSTSAVPSDISTTKNSGKNTTTNSGTDSTKTERTYKGLSVNSTGSGTDKEEHEGGITKIYNKLTDTHSGSDTHTLSGTDTRTMSKGTTTTMSETKQFKGNDGKYNILELLQEQREYLQCSYFSILFSDVDKILTISIY